MILHNRILLNIFYSSPMLLCTSLKKLPMLFGQHWEKFFDPAVYGLDKREHLWYNLNMIMIFIFKRGAFHETARRL